MSLVTKYTTFLAHPTADALAENASLHYITTLTSIYEAPAITRHFQVQEKLLKKKDHKLLAAIESVDSLSVDVEATIEFLNGGGAYLPGLDDNFVADRTVTFPMVHMVHFDKEQKIIQIRMYWDQGALLKQIEVIGARARNWPIRDGKDQARLISTSFATVAQPESAPASRPSTAVRRPDEVSIAERPITSSRRNTNNAMNDPHATLNLFQPRDVNLEDTGDSRLIAPRMQSAKPPPRDLSELFVGEDAGSPSPANASASPHKQSIPAKSGAGKSFKANRLFEEAEEEATNTTTANVPSSPKKRGIPAKSGAGKSFKANRLFEETEEDLAAATPISSVKTNAKKYQHFEFGDGDDDATPKVREPRKSTRSQHASKWDFDDFVTPEKTKPKVLAQNVRHFGWSDDEDEGSPVRRPIVHKARPGIAEPHFEFADDGTPDGERKKVSTKGSKGNSGMGLYQDHVLHYDDDTEEHAAKGDVKRALGDISTHPKNDIRKKDFDAHWEMNDNSPAQAGPTASKLTSNQGKVLKSLDANWGHEPSPKARGINIAGNGMGGRKGTEASWNLYDESPEKKENVNKGIKTAGNGMGGRKAGGFDWDF